MVTLFYLIVLNLGIFPGGDGCVNQSMEGQLQITPVIPPPNDGGAADFDDG